MDKSSNSTSKKSKKITTPQMVVMVSLVLLIISLISNLRPGISVSFFLLLANVIVHAFLLKALFSREQKEKQMIIICALLLGICVLKLVINVKVTVVNSFQNFDIWNLLSITASALTVGIYACTLWRSAIIYSKKSDCFGKLPKLFKALMILGYLDFICITAVVIMTKNWANLALFLTAALLVLLAEKQCPARFMCGLKIFDRSYDKNPFTHGEFTSNEIYRVNSLLKHRAEYLQYACSADVEILYDKLKQRYERLAEMAIPYALALSYRQSTLERRTKNPFIVGGVMDGLFGPVAGVYAAIKTDAKNEQIKEARTVSEQKLQQVRSEYVRFSMDMRQTLHALEKALDEVEEIRSRRLAEQQKDFEAGIALMKTDPQKATLEFKTLGNEKGKKMYSACKFQFHFGRQLAILATNYIITVLLATLMGAALPGFIWGVGFIVTEITLQFVFYKNKG